MTHLLSSQSFMIRAATLLASVIFAVVIMALFAGTRPVRALPEYTSLTGESCGVCHVNPGGGGPRTLRGLLWAAHGKPIQLPALPTVLLAPDVKDGYELYGIACASCHGARGEGSSAIKLVNTGISAGATRSFILYGIKPLGMPDFKGQLTDTQLNVLVDFVTNLAENNATPPPDFFPVAPGQLHGRPANPLLKSEGN